MDFFDSPAFRGENPSPLPSLEDFRARAATIDFENELNPEQYSAVAAPLGPSLVLAGAGSGKTRTLTYRVAWLLKEGVRPDQILLLTFTNKAAREMLGRVEELTGVFSSRFWGGTFHHIGQRILRQSGRKIGIEPSFNILDQGDSEALLKRVVDQIDPAYQKNKDNPKPRLIGDWISFSRNTRRPLSEIVRERAYTAGELEDSITKFAAAYEAAKRKQQVVDFDDILELWLRLLSESEESATFYGEKFTSILVDEYQDTNALQSQIIERMAPHHQITAVGDDAQCIYTWRGADFENIRAFPERHPNTTLYKIETNYRSTPNILNFANQVLFSQGNAHVFEKQLRAIREPGMPPAYITTTDTLSQADFIARRIDELVDDGFQPSDIAILYRAHYHAMDLQMEFSRRGIPFHITSGLRFFETAHVKDLAAQLRFLTNPQDSTAFLRFVALLPKVGPKTAEKIHSHFLEVARKKKLRPAEALVDPQGVAKIPKLVVEEWGSLAATLLQADLAIREQAAPDAVLQILIDGWYGDWLRKSHDNWQQRLDDLQSVAGFASRFETLEDLLVQLTLMSSETSHRSVEMQDQAVRMTTVHQAKGLEFPVIFVIGVADGLFPLQKAIDQGDVEEERRLFYVAVTRAKDHLYLLAPRVITQGGPPRLLGPSRFVLTVPEHQYQKIRYQPRPAW
ncbi:MAG: ATP-dependent helicase [Puniceicoccaceae bacterium]